jgi:amidophosphoribosyltransferase
MKEACGVFAAFSERGTDVLPKVFRGIEALQHRGQESWGLATAGKPVFKRLGLVSEWREFASELSDYSGASGIGHVRYSTKGRTTIDNAHPIDMDGEFSIAHNGTIINTEGLSGSLLDESRKEACESDTRLVGLRLLELLKEGLDWFRAFEKLGKEIIGAYCFVILNKEGEVFAVRDPRGYRPLSLGWHRRSSTVVAASESCALTAVDAEFTRDVEPGEIVRLGGPGKHFESFRFAPKMETAYCSFEYTYFAHPSSRINGVSVYEARKRVGKVLAEKGAPKSDVIVPVPDSARPAALGYSLQTGTPLDEGLMKDRYRRKGSIRSFIEPRQGSRKDVVKRIIPVREVIEGKKVTVVDDSVVRGTSAKVIARVLRRAGAKRIQMAVTFPPIRHPCFMGVDFPTKEELLAHRVAADESDPTRLEQKVATELGVDEFHYNDLEGLSRAIGIPKESLCFACVNGDYTKLGVAAASRKLEEQKVAL